MKIRMERGELVAGLSRVQGVVERRNTVPILSNVLLEADEGGIHMFATDLELGLRGTYKGEVLEPGGVTVQARKLFEIVRELEDGPVELTEADQWVTVTAGRSRFKVASLPVSDFPPVPEADGDQVVPVPRDVFTTMIRKTFFAVGDLDTRYVLNGVLMGPLSVSAIVPRKALMEVKRLLEEDEGPISLAFADKRMTFKKEGLTLVTQLVEGTFPSYEKVIPRDVGTRATLPREPVMAAFKRVSLLCQEKTWAVRFSLAPGNLTLQANNPDIGEATEEVAVQYEGEPFSSGFNARYFIDVLGTVDGDAVLLETADPLSPCVLKDGGDAGYLSLIMPMRL